MKNELLPKIDLTEINAAAKTVAATAAKWGEVADLISSSGTAVAFFSGLAIGFVFTLLVLRR